MKKVLITPQGFDFVSEDIRYLFAKDLEYKLTGGIIESKERLISNLKDCSGLIIGSEIVDKEVIDSAKSLKVIVRFGTSTENIDANYLKEKNIQLHTIKSHHTVKGVARLCLSFLLIYLNNILFHFRDNKDGLWTRYMNSDPEQITVGLVGSGDISREFFHVSSNMGFNFKYFSRKEKDYFSNKNIEFTDNLDDLISSSDVISVHLPLNKDTEKLFSNKHLNNFNNKLLINTSRAGIVDHASLRDNINTLENFYYFTDVLENEPPKKTDLELIQHPNVFSTSHVGGYSKSALIDVASSSIKLVNKYL